MDKFVLYSQQLFSFYAFRCRVGRRSSLEGKMCQRTTLAVGKSPASELSNNETCEGDGGCGDTLLDRMPISDEC